jgi:CRISPR/Cas system-associated exonuclease Cas4 (RecB family)
MNVNCSAGRGILTRQECLNCALIGDNRCGYDYSLLKAMLGSSQKEERANEIHVTDLTGCLRRAYYDKSLPISEYPHETLARFLGTAAHAAVEGTDEKMTSELPLSYDGLVGTADAYYANGRVVDFKTTRWMYVEKLPYGSHALQVNIYAYLLRKQGKPVNRLQIQYIDMSGPSKCRKCGVHVRMFHGELKCPKCFNYVKGAHLGAALVDVDIMRERDIETLIQERKTLLETAVMFSTPPAKEPGFLCDYCIHRDTCVPERED